jgi:hypothetical protein
MYRLQASALARSSSLPDLEKPPRCFKLKFASSSTSETSAFRIYMIKCYNVKLGLNDIAIVFLSDVQIVCYNRTNVMALHNKLLYHCTCVIVVSFCRTLCE